MKAKHLMMALAIMAVLCLGLSGCQTKNERIALVADGAVQARIVYPVSANKCIMDAIEVIENEICSLYGLAIPAESEAWAENTDNSIRIHIGSTAHPAAKSAMDALPASSYAIIVSDNQIWIVASNPYLYSIAAETLMTSAAITEEGMFLDSTFQYTSDSFPVCSLVTDGKSDYTIVYAENDKTAKENARLICDAIYYASDLDLKVIGDSEPISGKEILVGATNRPLSAQDKSYYLNACLQSDSEGNIAITGNIAVGAAELIKMISNLGDADKNNIEVPVFSLGIVAPSGYGNPPKYEGSGTEELRYSFEKHKSYYVLIHDAKRQDYTDYCRKLEAEGYEVYAQKSVKTHEFSTYFDGHTIVTLSHMVYTDIQRESAGSVSYISIAVDSIENSSLPPKATAYETVTTSQVSLIHAQCGFLVRLEDGKFLMIDGGLNREIHTEIIYEQLCSQNVLEGKPVIAAWIFTHPHTDHLGGFYGFTQKHAGDVVLESAIFNFPAYETYYGKNSDESSKDNPDNADTVSREMKSYSEKMHQILSASYPEANIAIAHAGQTYNYAGLVLDVLFTHETLYKKQMTDTNMSSVVYMLTMPRGKMIILGDMSTTGCMLLDRLYGSELKADVVQLAHHGYNGGNEGMYAHINATATVWTNSYEVIRENNLHNRPSYNHYSYNSVKYNLIMDASDRVMILTPHMTAEDLAPFIQDFRG